MEANIFSFFIILKLSMLLKNSMLKRKNFKVIQEFKILDFVDKRLGLKPWKEALLLL